MVRKAITGSGGKTSSCNYDDVLARLYHLTKLVHISTGSSDRCTLGSDSARDGESYSLKSPRPSYLVWNTDKGSGGSRTVLSTLPRSLFPDSRESSGCRQ